MDYSVKPVLIIAISLVAIAIGIPRLTHADAPSPTSTLAVGDWWKYNAETPVAGLILTGTQTQTIEANSTATLWSEKQTASGTLAGSGVTGQWSESGWGNLRKSDLAEVNSRFTLNMTVIGVTSATLYLAIISDNTPPITKYQFPLSTGSQWTMSGGSETVTLTYYYSFDQTRHTSQHVNNTDAVYNVLASSLTTVPAGTFDSYQIRQRSPDGSYSDSYYSPEAENIVKQIGYAANGTQLSSMTLTDYSAWAYKSSVELAMNGRPYIAIIATDVFASDIRQNQSSLSFHVSGTDGVSGKGIVWIPIDANNTDLKVFVDANPAAFTTSKNQTSYQILFTYPLSSHTITIIYASVTLQSPFLQQYMLPIILAAVAATAAVLVGIFLIVRRKPAPPPQPAPYQQPPAAPPTPTESPPPTPPPPTQS
jgi:hypothetical protein